MSYLSTVVIEARKSWYKSLDFYTNHGASHFGRQYGHNKLHEEQYYLFYIYRK